MQKIKSVFLAIKDFVLKRKILSIIILIALAFGVYKLFFSSTASAVTTYTVDTVSKETVISALSETGQVSVNGSIDLKPSGSASGRITSIKVKAGDKVYAGELIATIDSSNAYNTLKSARLSYQNALITYQKATSPSATSTILSAQSSLATSQASLSSSYTTAFNNITSTYSDLSSIISSLHDALYSTDLNSSQYNAFFFSDNSRSIESSYSLPAQANTLTQSAIANYTKVKADYDSAFSSYKLINAGSSNEDIYNNLKLANSVASELTNALKSSINMMQYYEDLYSKYSLTTNSKANTYLTNLKSYQSTINGDISNLTNTKSNIDSLTLSIPQQQLNLNTVSTGATGLDLDAASLSLSQAKLNYDMAQETYDNYFVKSPIDGVVSSVNTFVGADSSSNSIATIITNGKFANISVSETDISKIKLGQKVTLTFDAIDNFSLVGTVSEIDQAGTVSSGVVSYTVKIAFDDPSDQVKSGMSVTADIQTGLASDVIAVPSSAVKSTASGSYVLVFNSTSSLLSYQNSSSTFTSIEAPIKKTVVTGLVGDSYTEITQGLNEGDIIVTKTTTTGGTSSSKTTTTSTKSSSSSSSKNSGFGNPGMMDIMR